MKDPVTIDDALWLEHGQYGILARQEPKEPVQIQGFFSCLMRERGKIVPGSRREGHNIWTLTGREYLALLMSYGLGGSPSTPFRQDRVAYIGFGTGSQAEVPGVTSLVTPIAYTGTTFLAPLAIPDFPLVGGSAGLKTTVRYWRDYALNELSVSGSITLTEAGLYTDGDPLQSNTPGTRLTSLAAASAQAPLAYKMFDPFVKTTNYGLEASWEIRF